MNALRTLVGTYAIALLINLGFTTPLMAGSADFAGIFGAVNASVNGVEIDGTHTTGTGDSSGGGTMDEVTRGKAGAFVPVGGLEVGFNLPLGDLFFLGVGHSWVSGTGKIAEGDDFDNSSDFILKAKSFKTYYVQPSISIFDNSAVYFKYGRSFADLEVSGGVTGAPNNLNGQTVAMGTAMVSDNGLFIKTEAGASFYDTIKFVGAGGSGNSIVEGNPTIAHGSVSIGYKF